MDATADDISSLLDELVELMTRLESEGGIEDSLGLDYAKLGSFRSQRRERLVVKAAPHPVVALVLDGEKRFGARGRVRRGEVLLIPPEHRLTVVNVPVSPIRPYRAFVVVVAPRVAARLAARSVECGEALQPWAATEPRVLVPDRNTLLAVVHLARSLAERDAHLDLLRHRLEDVLLSLALTVRNDRDGGTRSQGQTDPAGAVRHLIRGEPSRAWVASAAAQRMGMSEPTLRRRLAATHTSFRAILLEERMRLARILLRDPGLSVSEVALRCGYRSPSKFAAQCERALGARPSRLKPPPERTGTIG